MSFYDQFDEDTPEYKYYEDLCLEVSVSNKARCRTCGKGIEKDVLRWCSSERDRCETVYVSKRYYHQNCLPAVAGHPVVDYNHKTKSGKLRPMHVNPSKKVEKDLFDNVVTEYVKWRVNFDKKVVKSDKNWNASDSDSEEEEVGKKVAKKATKLKTKDEKPKEKKNNKRARDSSDDEEDDKDVELAAYTDGERQKYQKKLEEYKSKTVAQLKAILKANNQTQTGTKDVLLEKVADGFTLGAIPQCTKCGGGKLRFNKSTGQYTCPGYMEDTDKIDCDAAFEKDQVTRYDWVNA